MTTDAETGTVCSGDRPPRPQPPHARTTLAPTDRSPALAAPEDG